jgi:hypothetical protein
MSDEPGVCLPKDIGGGCPAASYFFLPRQEKVTKKKATPRRRPLLVRCEDRGRRENSPRTGARLQTFAPHFSAFFAANEAASKGVVARESAGMRGLDLGRRSIRSSEMRRGARA